MFKIIFKKKKKKTKTNSQINFVRGDVIIVGSV